MRLGGSSKSCGVAVGEPPLLGSWLGYLAVFGAALGGYAGLGPWVIAVAAIALASVSRAQYSDLYERGRDLGLLRIIDTVMLHSFVNALLAAGIAYGGGWLLRII
jgi:hypothetical protein